MTRRLFIGGFIEPDFFGEKYYAMKRDADNSMLGRWTSPDNLHFTMQFLGDVDDVRLPEIADVLKNYLCVHFDDLYIKGIGFFPHHRAPKILYARIYSPSGAFLKIYDEIQKRLRSLGFEVDDRPFIPHITLKRITNAEIYDLPKFIQKYAEIDFGIKATFTLSLIESTLTREGSMYKAVHLPDSDFV